MSGDVTVKILFLLADPSDASRLRLLQEVRDIKERLQRAIRHSMYQLEQRECVRVGEITQAIFDFQPNIIHFSGHGTSQDGLCFENEMGTVQPVAPNALAAMFKLFSRQVNCVVLNACSSEIVARAIAKHISFAIGMQDTIEDKAAIAFAVGFYTALAANRSIEEAYESGCVQIQLLGFAEHLKPVLHKKTNSTNNLSCEELPSFITGSPITHPRHFFGTGLLTLDEFEVLDSAIAKGRFDEQDVLGMLRHIIQHRPRFKVLLAGSHTIEEYQRWASYLINVQVVHISYLKESEARQLIERPIQDFTLRYEPDAVERVLQLTRCHPFLVQLLCGEIVALKNEQDPSVRRLATLADVEAAVPEALSTGSFFFADIQNNQVDAAGLAILRFIATQRELTMVSHKTLSQQFTDNCDRTLNLLLQRELIEEVDNAYRFQVELIRQWFVQ